MRNAHSVSWLAAALLLGGLPHLAAPQEATGTTGSLVLTSPAFAQGGGIPSRYTNDGENVSPPLVIAGAPRQTVTFALIMDDPDAPAGTWVHWVVWNIPTGTGEIPSGTLPGGAVEGRNSWDHSAYGGPAPPSGTHRYFLRLYALDTSLSLSRNADAAHLRRAMEGHVLATAELMGTFRHR